MYMCMILIGPMEISLTASCESVMEGDVVEVCGEVQSTGLLTDIGLILPLVAINDNSVPSPGIIALLLWG